MRSRRPASSTRAHTIVRRSGRSVRVMRRRSRIRPGSRTSSWFEPPSHDAIRSGLTNAASRCSGGTTLRDVNPRTPVAAVRSPERSEPERRGLLKQRHVPLVVGKPAAELAQ